MTDLQEKAMTDYVKSYYKADLTLIINEAREKWKLKNGQTQC